jgi:transposase-like protein
MGAGRKIRDEAEARDCVLAVERAGQSAGEWARAHGIDGRSLQAWKITFGRGRPSVPQPSPSPKPRTVVSPLVELVPRKSVGQVNARHVHGVRLEFGNDVSSDTLRRVLAVLRAC